MASTSVCRRQLNAYMRPLYRSAVSARLLTTSTKPPAQSFGYQTTLSQSFNSEAESSSPYERATSQSTRNTHFKITLRRSAISLGEKIKGTLESLGIHRRHQTVYFPHSPEVAGKILRVKELVEVENVPSHQVFTSYEQRQQRKSPKSYTVVRSRMSSFMNI